MRKKVFHYFSLFLYFLIDKTLVFSHVFSHPQRSPKAIMKSSMIMEWSWYNVTWTLTRVATFLLAHFHILMILYSIFPPILMQGCIFFPWFLYPSLFILWWNYIYFIILGGVHNYETFLLLICFIIFQKSSKSCKIFTILLLICLIFLISFPVLSKVLIDLGHVYGPNRKNIHPCNLH